MNEESFYRSEHGTAHHYWATHCQRREEFSLKCKALLADFPGCELAERSFMGNHRIFGLFSEAAPGPEWRMRAGDDYWTPNLRSKVGKALAERLKTIYCQDPAIPGMPDLVYVEHGKARTPGCALYGSVLWVNWAVSAEKVEREPSFKSEIWHRAKASEYHLAREASVTEAPANA